MNRVGNLPTPVPVATPTSTPSTPSTQEPQQQHVHHHHAMNKNLARRRNSRAGAHSPNGEQEHPELEELATLAMHHPQNSRKKRKGRGAAHDPDGMPDGAEAHDETFEHEVYKDEREKLKNLVLDVAQHESQQDDGDDEQRSHSGPRSGSSQRDVAHRLARAASPEERNAARSGASQSTQKTQDGAAQFASAQMSMMSLQRLLLANGSRRPGDKLAWQALGLMHDHIAYLRAHPGDKDKKLRLATLLPWLKTITAPASPGFSPSEAQGNFYLLFPLRPLQMLAPRLRSQLGQAAASSGTLCLQQGKRDSGNSTAGAR